MARLLGPDANSRLVYSVAGTRFASQVAATATVYADAAGTALANIATYDGTGNPGAVIAGSVLTVDANSLLPMFWFPDGVDKVYVKVGLGPIVAVNADYDARLDALAASGGAVQSVNGKTGVVVLTSADVSAVPTTAIGAALGVASLDAAGKVPVAQIPTLATGNMSWRGAWTANTVYAVDDVVKLFDTAMLCVTAHTSGAAFSLANWVPLGVPASTFNVMWYGAKGDGRVVTDGAITTGTAALSSPTAAWTAADVGKPIMVKGAGLTGQTTLVTTISAYVSPTQVTLAAAASTTVASGAWALWGTDDTAAVQSTINAAYNYAVGHGSGAKVWIPAAPAAFYAIAGPLQTGGTTKGNAQLTIPIAPVAASKVTLEIEGAVNGTGLFHWQQTTAQFSGSTLLSFGNFANATAQSNSINANGQPSLIGGPDQPGGYGTNTLLFSNMLVTLRNLELITTYSSSGLTYTAACFVGIAEANVFDCQIGVAATYLSDNLSNPNPLSAGLSIGLFMPANGNNDNNVIRNLSIQGGYTYGLFATEHTVINALRITYCWAALIAVGGYGGMVGASHAVYVDAMSCEGCIRHVYLYGSAQAGEGPTVTIGQLDTEGIPIVYDGSNVGNGGHGLGDIAFTGYNAPQVPNPTGIKLRNLIQQPGYVATPAYTLGTPFMNPHWRDATYIISGGTITGIRVGRPNAGVACLGGSTAPTMQSLGITSGTVRVPSGGWLAIDGTVAPNVAVVLD